MHNANHSFIDKRNLPVTHWMAYVLGLHVLVWVVAHGISDTNLDGYADMLENFACTRRKRSAMALSWAALAMTLEVSSLKTTAV